MPKVVAHYDSIYLVAMYEEKTSSHRMTEREGGKRPGTISFSGNHPLETGEDTYSALVLNEELWQEWFGDRTRLPHAETAAFAAEYLVSHFPHIYYGCPLCTFRCNVLKEARGHIHEHINKFVQQFRMEVEEE